VVVVGEVLGAFTKAAFAFDRCAKETYLVSTVEEAFELHEQDSSFLLAGKVNGYPIEGFDLPNSPSAMANLDLTGQRLAMRTTAGTQDVVGSTDAAQLCAASLSVATATVEIIQKLNPESVIFIETGGKPKGGGEEDIACSD
jgi:2-phosphosulfolactate phosphatase